MIELKKMSIEELKQLATNISLELDSRVEDIKEVKKEVEEMCLDQYSFTFKTECSYRHRGYVAKCYYLADKEKGMQRKFYHMEDTRSSTRIFLEGEFKAKERDILEIKYKNKKFGKDGLYIVFEGKLVKICDDEDLQTISTTKQYLQGNIIFDKFLDIVGIKKADDIIEDLLEGDDD